MIAVVVIVVKKVGRLNDCLAQGVSLQCTAIKLVKLLTGNQFINNVVVIMLNLCLQGRYIYIYIYIL